MAKMGETFEAAGRAAWRRWLEEHHEICSEVWLVFHKKHTGRASVTYDEAVEEALCFGWIDGRVQSIDDDRHAYRFTPRKPDSGWSALNKERVQTVVTRCAAGTKPGIDM
jgi:uncharacterized protein YdeI (YjbR/CyaY-like superfamily)